MKSDPSLQVNPTLMLPRRSGRKATRDPEEVLVGLVVESRTSSNVRSGAILTLPRTEVASAGSTVPQRHGVARKIVMVPSVDGILTILQPTMAAR